MSRGVLVTGASGGIGRAVAAAFARAGDWVAVHYSTRRAEAERTLSALPGAGHALVSGDLADSRQVADLAAAANTALGGLDVLVNNAAVVTAGYPVAATDYGTWQRHLARHPGREPARRGQPELLRRTPAHRPGRRGRHRGRRLPRRLPRRARRARVRREQGRPARARPVARRLPRPTRHLGHLGGSRLSRDRPGRGRLAGGSGAAIRAQSPYGRVATPEEVAAAIVYLASPAARWSTGAVLDVNGASYLR